MRIVLRIRASLITGFWLLAWVSPVVRAQTDNFSKNFKKLSPIVPGVDFFAGQRSDVTPFEKPISEARRRLTDLLGEPLAKGALVIATTPEQKDAASEARLLKMGYRWVLIQVTPAAAGRQSMAQTKALMESMKARTGGPGPAGAPPRMPNPSPEMEAAAAARFVTATVQRFAYAVLLTTLAPDKPFRSSRLDDMGRSPLADWLDIGLAAHAAGSAHHNLKFLQDRLDETFPLEDLLEMSRPFVPPAPVVSGPAGGGAMYIQKSPGPGAPPSGGAPAPPGPGGPRAPAAFSMPKDVQDRMIFDAQAAAFFTYLLNKIGFAKLKELVDWNRQGKGVREFLIRADVLGPDLDGVEKDWQSWVKTQQK